MRRVLRAVLVLMATLMGGASLAAEQVLTFEEGFVGPFALHPEKPLLAVLHEHPWDREQVSTLNIYDLSGEAKLERTIPVVGSCCADMAFWSPANDQVLVVGEGVGKLRRIRVFDAQTGVATRDLGSQHWGSVHVSEDGKYLASVLELRYDEAFNFVTTLYRTSDWEREGQTSIVIENPVYPPVFINRGFGLLHFEDGYFWEYSLAEGTLVTSRPAPDEPGEVLKLIENAAPGGESLIYVANDYQSGFDRPLPQLWGRKLPKHVFDVPNLDVICKVEGGGIEDLRDFQKAYLGSRYVARPGAEAKPVYQWAVAGGPLLAFVMPPVDPFVNPFGSGQRAFVIDPQSDKCVATEVTSLERDPFYFDANNMFLLVTNRRHKTTNDFRGLQVFRISQSDPP
jgi:hypothetical protein